MEYTAHVCSAQGIVTDPGFGPGETQLQMNNNYNRLVYFKCGFLITITHVLCSRRQLIALPVVMAFLATEQRLPTTAEATLRPI